MNTLMQMGPMMVMEGPNDVEFVADVSANPAVSARTAKTAHNLAVLASKSRVASRGGVCVYSRIDFRETPPHSKLVLDVINVKIAECPTVKFA
ncbi:unnamed protein product [Nippostrongylus brasiliensis]|uniref:N-acetylmuramoyl-L-alanine amidase n=1 Tax=Nippostrongylus brasiliensis TaxID=27835 RepID=A0A0N4Y4R9_NIPBR|nr:unnamed protein product [Nippostrongylus brasiliensis]